MFSKRRKNDQAYAPYNTVTEPIPVPLIQHTAPIPAHLLPRETRGQRFFHGLHRFFRALVHKFDQLFGLALAVVVLLLVGRFLLTMFVLDMSIFAYWINFLSAPLAYPFEKLTPVLQYDGYIIDTSILVAIVVYVIIRILAKSFLRMLVR